jgi:hypothetical protein
MIFGEDLKDWPMSERARTRTVQNSHESDEPGPLTLKVVVIFPLAVWLFVAIALELLDSALAR